MKMAVNTKLRIYRLNHLLRGVKKKGRSCISFWIFLYICSSLVKSSIKVAISEYLDCRILSSSFNFSYVDAIFFCLMNGSYEPYIYAKLLIDRSLFADFV